MPVTAFGWNLRDGPAFSGVGRDGLAFSGVGRGFCRTAVASARLRSAAGCATAVLRAAVEDLRLAVRPQLLDKPKYAQLERDARRLYALLPSCCADPAALRDLERGVGDFLQAAADRVGS